MNRKWIGLCAAALFGWLHPACSVPADDAADSENTAAASQATVLGTTCTKNSQCRPDEWCIKGECRRQQMYPDPIVTPVPTIVLPPRDAAITPP